VAGGGGTAPGEGVGATPWFRFVAGAWRCRVIDFLTLVTPVDRAICPVLSELHSPIYSRRYYMRYNPIGRRSVASKQFRTMTAYLSRMVPLWCHRLSLTLAPVGDFLVPYERLVLPRSRRKVTTKCTRAGLPTMGCHEPSPTHSSGDAGGRHRW